MGLSFLGEGGWQIILISVVLMHEFGIILKAGSEIAGKCLLITDQEFRLGIFNSCVLPAPVIPRIVVAVFRAYNASQSALLKACSIHRKLRIEMRYSRWRYEIIRSHRRGSIKPFIRVRG